MTEHTLNVEMPALHPSQQAVHDGAARFRVLATGRRWGKTRLAAISAIEHLFDGRRTWWIAPTYQMANIGWRLINRLLRPVAHLMEVRRSAREINCPSTDGNITIRSGDDPDRLRGEGLDLAILDECAFLSGDVWTHAIRPALADRQGSALFCSTPKGRNWFWRLWTAAPDTDGWERWRFSTRDNPYIQPAEIEQAAEHLPERIYRQEFEAEFIEDAGGVFRGVVAAATVAPQRSRTKGAQYVFGVDWGKSNDYTVIIAIDVATKAVVAMDRFNRIDYQFQLSRLQAMADKWKPLRIIAERNAMGEPLIEQLQRNGLPVEGFTTSSASKTTAIESLALAIERQEIHLLMDETLIAELQAYEMNRLPSGALRYSAPAGVHDDCVMALALAWSAVADDDVPHIYVGEEPTADEESPLSALWAPVG